MKKKKRKKKKKVIAASMYIANHKQFEKSTGNPNPKKRARTQGFNITNNLHYYYSKKKR
jgi:hypothetical protein